MRLDEAKTFLFTPGDQPSLVEKGLQSSADVVIIDLEDAVRSENKRSAREYLKNLSRSSQAPLVAVRTNAIESEDFESDVEVALGAKVHALIIPKFVAGHVVRNLEKKLAAIEKRLMISSPTPVIGLIESATGLLSLLQNYALPSRVTRLALGGADLATDLGVSHTTNEKNLNFARSILVVASVSAHLSAPIDSPEFSLEDEKFLAESGQIAYEMGFGGKLCIHPKQLSVVARIFSASVSEREWASRAIAKWESDPDHKGAISVDGALVDEAMVKRARQILGLI